MMQIGIGLGILMSAGRRVAPLVPAGAVAYIEGSGQSNMVGYNDVDSLPSGDRRVYDGATIWTANGSLPTSTFSEISYLLAGTGETVGGVLGRRGEFALAQSSGGIGPTYGVMADETLFGTASRSLGKPASAGKPLSDFVPGGPNWNQIVYYRRAIRGWGELIAGNVHGQCKIWFQGEANTNPARAAGDVNDFSITGYAADFERVYQFDIDQYGVSMPWFICALADISDIYTDAMNDVLRGLCRWTVNFTAGEYVSVTDNGSGNNLRYFVDHGLSNGSDNHLTALQMKQIGVGIAAAMRARFDGFVPRLIEEIKPVYVEPSCESPVSSLARISGRATDAGTLYAAAVPTGAAAPTVAQIVAGAGGGIVDANSIAITLASNIPAIRTVDLRHLAGATEYDTYTVLGIASGELSIARPVTITTGATSPVWETTFNTSLLTYSGGGLVVNNTTGGTRFPRAANPGKAGKKYFEVSVSTASSHVGILSPDSGIGGGTNGSAFCGWAFSNFQYTGGNVSMGGNTAASDIVQVAVDLDARTMWIRRNGAGNWNNTSGDNPETGVGGRSISNMPLSVTPCAGLASGTANSATLAASTFTYSPPTGFSPWV